MAILALAQNGVMSGYLDGTFRPQNPLVRAQFARVIVGAMEIPVTEATPYGFKDLGPDTASLYPHEYVGAAAEKLIVKGYVDGTFRPYTNVTRTQVIAMIVRAARNLRPGLLSAPPSTYRSSLGNFDRNYAADLGWAQYNGLLQELQGYGSGWNPWAVMNRGEVAQVLWNLMKKM
jgi:hypothetical protein